MKSVFTYALLKGLFHYLLAVGMISLLTAVLFLFRDRLNHSTVMLIYLIPVLACTTLWGLGPGVLSSFSAFLAYNYYFIKPYYTLAVHENQDIVALVIFLVVAVLISQLVGKAKSSLAAAVSQERETARLYELSQNLAGVNDLEEIASVIAKKTVEAVPVRCLELRTKPIYDEDPFALKLPADIVCLNEPDVIIPLETVRAYLGEIRLWLQGSLLKPGEERLLRTFAAQGALALERTALEQTQTRARVLEESDRLKTALLSSVSHEFHTPLAIIMAATTSLLNDQVPWEPQARNDLLNAVIEEADYLNYLVGNLLDMSRIEAGALRPNRQWNMLSEIIEGVVSRLHRKLVVFQIMVDIPDELPLIPVDYSQIEQVFINLLNNSVKYAPEGSEIQVCARAKTEAMYVQVRNQGPQVNPEHLERIFDKFFRVTEPERVSGTGLGLSICKGIIEAHGGQIWAENVPGGLAFTFRLPLIWDGTPPPVVREEDL